MPKKKQAAPKQMELNSTWMFYCVQVWWVNEPNPTQGDYVAALNTLKDMPYGEQLRVVMGNDQPESIPPTQADIRNACDAAIEELERYDARRRHRPAGPDASWWGVLCSDATVEVYRYDTSKGKDQVYSVIADRDDVVEAFGPFEAADREDQAREWIFDEIARRSNAKQTAAQA